MCIESRVLVATGSPRDDNRLTANCVMLLVFQLFSGNLQSGALMNSIAARFLFILGAHVQSYPDRAGQTLLPTGMASRTDNHRASSSCFNLLEV
ncbi:hypothetical protein POJ06DRAFT_41570 [Lipomyces tetrasporus]|uniref:Uncharacterized protein n=1 Tax=Lipomyces tetrasporus TaxID=54092 RepID=A0AAD7QJY2_9ASCO|nr:uncharacterized protein POJ06DRAFT_41570 [Lipomyces tetrasporus]KAJ8096612.1 hypothetical protein POJ06DRAFT_41570 [Lipomyces tetrasporus]